MNSADDATAAAFEEQIEDHFDTTVLQRRHSDVEELNRELLEIIRELETEFKDTDQNAVRTGNITTQGGYQTSGGGFLRQNHAAVTRLREEIIAPAVKRYLAVIYQARNSINYVFSSWANILREGDWQAPHMHSTPYNMASGVYYVKVPEKPEPQGYIEFINPQPISVQHGRNPTRRIKPAEGAILIFPPYYMHFVHPFRGEGERAIISFDVILQPLQVTF